MKTPVFIAFYRFTCFGDKHNICEEGKASHSIKETFRGFKHCENTNMTAAVLL